MLGWQVLLIKICKIQPTGYLFLVVFISFYIFHKFSELHSTLSAKNIFVTNFSFLTDSITRFWQLITDRSYYSTYYICIMVHLAWKKEYLDSMMRDEGLWQKCSAQSITHRALEYVCWKFSGIPLWPIFQVAKQVQKNSLISDTLPDEVWWCNIKWVLSYSKNCICYFMQPNPWHKYSTFICPFKSEKSGK